MPDPDEHRAAHADLSGRWLGRYDYPDGRPPVPFEADLLDDGGAVSGQITEQNSFVPGAGAVLVAWVTGTRQGDALGFEKRYAGFDPLDCPSYEGRTNVALTRISGRWFFRHDRAWSGRFVMMRKPLARAATGRTAGAKTGAKTAQQKQTAPHD